jgi:hypothetical protein
LSTCAKGTWVAICRGSHAAPSISAVRARHTLRARLKRPGTREIQLPGEGSTHFASRQVPQHLVGSAAQGNDRLPLWRARVGMYQNTAQCCAHRNG